MVPGFHASHRRAGARYARTARPPYHLIGAIMDVTTGEQRLVQIPVGAIRIEGVLAIPQGARAVVLFAHGSGSSRHSPRNQFVAQALQERGLGTLLIDLL